MNGPVASNVLVVVLLRLFHPQLRLSVEHSGFTFQKNPAECADMLKLHSGGKVSEAVCMHFQVQAKPAEEATTATPSRVPARRSNLDREGPVDLMPPPERKGGFCCFGC